MIPLDFEQMRWFGDPFAHFVVQDSLDEPFATELLTWLEHYRQWNLIVADFYKQHEFSLLDVELPAGLSVLTDADALSCLATKMEDLFSADISKDKIDVTAHRLTRGQLIRIHNDYIAGQETHRLLIQLNRGWHEANGGTLMLFAGPRPEDVVRLVHPANRLVFGFEISQKSFHAVTPIEEGDRFTLVYSFHGT